MSEAVGDFCLQVRAALGAFASESQRQGRRLRELLDSSPAEFVEVAREVLLEVGEAPERRYLVALLSARGLLTGLLKELGRLDRGAAGAVARMAQRMDPGFEKALARSILEAQAQQAEDLECQLGLVEALTGGSHVLPLLGKLRHSENPKVRSKLARMLGQTARAHEWFNTMRSDPDARVRANAIESLWAARSPYAAACFESALEDPHHRVMANGLVGLYLMGDVESIRKLAEMAGHVEAPFRAAAAWAMGRTGDPRFVPLLRALRKDGHNPPAVLRRALHAITRIGHGLATARRARLTLRVVESGAAEDWDGAIWERAVVVARGEGGGELPEIRATEWILEADGQPAWRYAVQKIAAPARMALSFLLPVRGQETGVDTVRTSHWQRLLDGFLALQRQNDLMALQFYSEEPHAHYLERRGDILRIGADSRAPAEAGWEGGHLMGDALRLRTALAAEPEARHLPEGLAGALKAQAEALQAAHGGRHVLLVLDQPQEAAWSERQTESAWEWLQKHAVTLHAVALRQAPAEIKGGVSLLCRRSGGLFLESETLKGATTDACDIVASLYKSYRLTFPGKGKGQRKVEVQSCAHEGSTEWTGQENAAAA